MRSRVLHALVSVLVLGLALAAGQRRDAGDMLARIRTEGLQRSRALALYRTLTDEIGARLTGSPAHMQAARWALRPLRGMGPCQPASRAVRVRPRLVARTRVGGDDGAALRAAHRLRRRVVAVDRRRRRWTGGLRRRQDCRADPGDGRAASRRHRADAPSADRVRRLATGRSPASTIARWRPAIPRCRRRGARRLPRADAAAQASGRGRGAAAERVPRRHGRRDRQSRHSPGCGAVDCRGRRAVQRAGASGRAGTPGVAARRAARRATSRRTATATTSSPRSRDTIRRCAIRSCSLARTSTRGTPRAAPPTTPTALSPSWRRCASSARSAPQPRRTIRVALWSGEEQGLLGARAYVAQHFNTPAARDQLAVYLNDDPGSGKTLGFYMEGNSAAKAHLRSLARAAERPGRDAQHHRGHRLHRPRAVQ